MPTTSDPPPKTYTVKRTYPPEVEGEIIAAGVDFDGALAANEGANYNAIIIDDSDGLPACMMGVDLGCECPRCVPDLDVGVLPGDWHVRGPITVETGSFIPPAEISAARIDQEHETMVEGGLRVTFSGLVTEGTMAGWWCVKGTSAPRADDEPVVVAQIPAAGRREP